MMADFDYIAADLWPIPGLYGDLYSYTSIFELKFFYLLSFFKKSLIKFDLLLIHTKFELQAFDLTSSLETIRVYHKVQFPEH